MPNKKGVLSEDMAPLEQNEKNLECEGVHYTIVKEEPKPHQINVSRSCHSNLVHLQMNSISPSRTAQKRIAEQANNKGKKYQLKKDASCFAIKASINASNEEMKA